MAGKSNIEGVIKTIREQGYKYCCLTNNQQQTVVTYNRPSQDKNGLNKKIEEIKKRLSALPDGTYYVTCRNSFHNVATMPGDVYPVTKGEVSLQEPPMTNGAINLHMPRMNGDSNKVMTYTEALVLTQENATMKAEISFLKEKIMRLEIELEAKQGLLAEQGDKPNWQEWADTTIPSILPVVDRYFALEEKKLGLKEKQLQLNGGKTAQKKQGKKLEIPHPESPEFEQFLDWIESLDDKQYEHIMLYLNKTNPEVYEIVYNEFEVEGEEGNEGQEGEGEGEEEGQEQQQEQ